MSELWAPTTLINLFLENYMKKYIIFVCGIWKNSKYFSLVGYDLSEQEDRQPCWYIYSQIYQNTHHWNFVLIVQGSW